jgi:hypothetical protein
MTQFTPDQASEIIEPDYPVIVSNLQQQLEDLASQIQNLSSSTRSSAPVGSPKVRLPEKFSGDRKSFRGFLSQLELVFRVKAVDYSSDMLKISTFGTLLDGKALKWFLPYLEKGLVDTMTWKEFVVRATETFGESCRVLNAESHLMNLVQHGSLIDYITEFTALAIDLNWSENALISHFRRGLSPGILDLMVAYDVPGTLNELITLATQIDGRIWENKQIRKSRSMQPERNQTRPTRPPAPRPPSVRVSDAMEIDASRRGPIDAKERNRRVQNNLCLYCGNDGHRLKDCPSRSRTLNVATVSKVKSDNQGKGKGQ